VTGGDYSPDSNELGESMKKTALLAGVCLPLLAILMISLPRISAAAEPEAPIAIPETTAGHWQLDEGSQNRPASRREPALYYQAEVFPHLSLSLVSFRCKFPGDTQIEITGLLPAQRFPQPAVTLRVGANSWSGTPNATYHARSQPVAAPNIRFQNGTLSWPGHPAYASLAFFNRDRVRPFEALGSGAAVHVAFEGQQRSFPAVPAEMAARFARGCRDVASPPVVSAR
jgi:hypothetical protein